MTSYFWENTLFFLIITGIVVFISRRQDARPFPFYLLIAWFFRCIMAAILYFTYTKYYSDRSTADIFKYFDDAQHWYQLWKSNPAEAWRIWFGFNPLTNNGIACTDKMIYWEKINHYGFFNDNKTIIRIHALLYLISRGNYFIHYIICCLPTFWASAFLFSRLKKFLDPFSLKTVYTILFFLPSLVFWTAGPTKESLLLAIIMAIMALLFDFKQPKINTQTLIPLFFVISLSIALAIVKMYVLLFLLVAFFPAACAYWLKLRKPAWAFSAFYFLFIPLLLFLNYQIYKPQIPEIPTETESQLSRKLESESYQQNALGSGMNILEKLKFKQQDFQKEASISQAGSAYTLPTLDGTPENLLFAVPQGIITTLFAPFPWELRKKSFIWPLSENLLLLLSWFIFFQKKRKICLSRQALFWLCFALSIGAFYGMLIPLLGNLIRYKLPVTLILFLWPWIFSQSTNATKTTQNP